MMPGRGLADAVSGALAPRVAERHLARR